MIIRILIQMIFPDSSSSSVISDSSSDEGLNGLLGLTIKAAKPVPSDNIGAPSDPSLLLMTLVKVSNKDALSSSLDVSGSISPSSENVFYEVTGSMVVSRITDPDLIPATLILAELIPRTDESLSTKVPTPPLAKNSDIVQSSQTDP